MNNIFVMNPFKTNYLMSVKLVSLSNIVSFVYFYFSHSLIIASYVYLRKSVYKLHLSTYRSFANSHFHVVHVLLYLSYVYDIDNDYVEIWAFKNVCLFIIYLLIVVLCVVVFLFIRSCFWGCVFFAFIYQCTLY